jgi:hypothetical protein
LSLHESFLAKVIRSGFISDHSLDKSLNPKIMLIVDVPEVHCFALPVLPAA